MLARKNPESLSDQNTNNAFVELLKNFHVATAQVYCNGWGRQLLTVALAALNEWLGEACALSRPSFLSATWEPASQRAAREKEISAMSGMRSCYDFSLCLADAAIYTQLSVEKTLMLNIFLNLIRHPSQPEESTLDCRRYQWQSNLAVYILRIPPICTQPTSFSQPFTCTHFKRSAHSK